MENKRAHLEMIQGVVNRLAHDSFLLKGWSVVLVSALFALAAGKANQYFIYLAYMPAIAFWILDGHSLWQERRFRALYDKVRTVNEDNIDFSMDRSELDNEPRWWPDAMLSKTLLVFHGTVMSSIVVVMVIGIILRKGGQ